jgi:hypothetical protein
MRLGNKQALQRLLQRLQQQHSEPEIADGSDVIVMECI